MQEMFLQESITKVFFLFFLSSTYSYEPLTLEELQTYYHDPFWQKLRKFMVFMYFALLAATLVFSCIIAYSARRSMSCNAKVVIDSSTTENSNSTLFNVLINNLAIDDVIH